MNFIRAYAVGSITVGDELHLIVASEAIDGKCVAYHGKNFDERKVIWSDQGGTMSIVPIPHTNGEFLAVRNFFPGFNGIAAKVVHVKPEGASFVVKDFINLPYLHRFDLITEAWDNLFYWRNPMYIKDRTKNLVLTQVKRVLVFYLN